MIKGENVRIMIGDKVVGFAESAQLTFAEDDENTKEFSDPWRTPDIKQWWDITGNAMVRDAGDVLRDLLNGKEKWDVTIGQDVGKLPRKMKKADKRDPYGKTKWGRKALNYRRKHSTIINDAEIVITKQDQETLTATITKAMKKPVLRARVSGEDFKRAMERYYKRN